ncbi:MAG: ADP-ribosylation factor family protein [Candidatus Hermodarchaeota archaeon]
MNSYVRSQEITPTGAGDARRIAFVGLELAGKTTTLQRLSRGLLLNTKPTHGFNLELFDFLGLRFNVFDLGGQATYHVFWEKFLPDQEAVVFFIDAADTKRLARVRLALNKTIKIVKPDTVFMILANKQDLPNALSLPDLSKALDLSPASKFKKFLLFAVSAKTGEGLREAFEWLASALDMDIGGNKCTLYGFYVYEKEVGLPLVTSEDKGKKIVDLENPIITRNPTLVTGLHSALRNFMSDVAESELKSVIFKAKTGKLFKFVSVIYGSLICVLVTNEGDNENVIDALGEAILEIVHEKVDSSELMPNLDKIDLYQLVEVIAPFVRNINDLKARFRPSTPKLDPHSPAEKLKALSARTASRSATSSTSRIDESRSNISTDLLKVTTFNQNNSTEDQKERVNTLISRSSPNNPLYSSPSPKSQPPSSVSRSEEASSSTSNSLPQQDNRESAADIFFHMSVADRIKYLQKTRKRLRD